MRMFCFAAILNVAGCVAFGQESGVPLPPKSQETRQSASPRATTQLTLESSAHPLYRNEPYGYVVELPPGLTYALPAPPNPNHGISIAIKERGELWVDASYVDSLSLVDEAKTLVGDCLVERKRATAMGGRRALQLEFSCPATFSSPAYSELLVFAVHQVGDRSPAGYQIVLRTERPRRSPEGKSVALTNRELFFNLIKGFRFQ